VFDGDEDVESHGAEGPSVSNSLLITKLGSRQDFQEVMARIAA
jgi:hypothetical protein